MNQASFHFFPFLTRNGFTTPNWICFVSASCQSALSAEEDGSWDYVINCACETKPGQTDPVYREGILKLSLNCAIEAAKLNVKRFVEVSSGHMCSSNKVSFKHIAYFELHHSTSFQMKNSWHIMNLSICEWKLTEIERKLFIVLLQLWFHSPQVFTFPTTFLWIGSWI